MRDIPMIHVKYDREEITRALVKPLMHDPDNGCVDWLGHVNQFGTAKIRIKGAIMDVIKVVWWLKHGYKPQWKHMVNKCGYKECMNPDHFEDRTPQRLRKKDLIKIQERVIEDSELARFWEQRWIEGRNTADMAKENGVSRSTMVKAIQRYDKTLPK